MTSATIRSIVTQSRYLPNGWYALGLRADGHTTGITCCDTPERADSVAHDHCMYDTRYTPVIVNMTSAEARYAFASSADFAD